MDHPKGGNSSSAHKRRSRQRDDSQHDGPTARPHRTGTGDNRDSTMGVAMLTLIGVLAAVVTVYWVLSQGLGGGPSGMRARRPAPPNPELRAVARQLLNPDKGILAADESPTTFGKRLRPGTHNSEDVRRRWRRLLLTVPGLEEHISGVMLHAETFGQLPEELSTAASRGVALGIKLDTGTAPLAPKKAGETVTRGLEGLAARCAPFAAAGAAFAKWRAVFRVGPHTPSGPAVRRNGEQLAEFAAVAQRCGLVPIIEPEVLAEGDHSLQRAAAATARVLKGVFRALRARGDVDPGAILLKVAFVTPGRGAPGPPPSPEQVANATLRVLLGTVPRVVPGIVFLSGGQSEADATATMLAVGRLAAPRSGTSAGSDTGPEAGAAASPGTGGGATGQSRRRRRRPPPPAAAEESDGAGGDDGAVTDGGVPPPQRQRATAELGGEEGGDGAQPQPQGRERKRAAGTGGSGAGARPKGGKPLPWSLSFSFGRALQSSALDAWQRGDEGGAVRALLGRAAANAAAQQGREPSGRGLWRRTGARACERAHTHMPVAYTRSRERATS